jgi:hypothetical protein
VPDAKPKPFQPEEFGHNGAGVVYVPEFKKWGAFDVHGSLHGLRRSLDAARELAQRLPGTPREPEPPPPIRRSPRVLPLPPEEPEVEVIPADQRHDFFEAGGGMSLARARTVGRPSER